MQRAEKAGMYGRLKIVDARAKMIRGSETRGREAVRRDDRCAKGGRGELRSESEARSKR
jgi:hypothetical protein